jgi:hypothetical protein
LPLLQLPCLFNSGTDDENALVWAGSAATWEKRKKGRRGNVSFGPSHVRFIQALSDENNEAASNRSPCHHDIDEHDDESTSLPSDCIEDVKVVDGPSEASVYLDRLLRVLLTQTGPLVIINAMKLVSSIKSTRALESFKARLADFALRIRNNGKARLVRAGIAVRPAALPCLDWVMECIDRALEARRQAVMDMIAAASSSKTHANVGYCLHSNFKFNGVNTAASPDANASCYRPTTPSALSITTHAVNTSSTAGVPPAWQCDPHFNLADSLKSSLYGGGMGMDMPQSMNTGAAHLSMRKFVWEQLNNIACLHG